MRWLALLPLALAELESLELGLLQQMLGLRVATELFVPGLALDALT